ncbi:MAG: prolipoprotein diacylglyceryl transferase [Ruminococcaceae bacterium]|nr:prolipoprotein diacylglyceryl transferase [Oscillospiraceae bacterium]
MILSRITFPGLGISVDPSPVAFSIGGKEIYWYGIIIAAGFFLAVVYALRRTKEFGLVEDDILDGVICVTPVAVICARAYYCIFNWEMFADNPISVLYIWEGGIAIYGSVIGAVLMTYLYTRWKKLPLMPILDLVALGFMIGQFIGRWGNFMNREAFGAVTDSFLRMGLENAYGEVTYYHPTFLYESVWNFVGFIALHFYSKRRKFDGEIFALYVAWYGLGRAIVEGLRTDSLYLFSTGIRVSQLLALISCVCAVAYLVWRYRRKPDPRSLYVHKKAALETEQEEIRPQTEGN